MAEGFSGVGGNGLPMVLRGLQGNRDGRKPVSVVGLKWAGNKVIENRGKVWAFGNFSPSWLYGCLQFSSLRLAAIQAQLNNLRREIKKVNDKVYAAQVGCELCKGPHYTKDCPLKEEGKTLEEAYYIQFVAPYQPGGHYRAAWPGFYQRNNGNSLYPDRRQTLEESLTKFMAESAKRHEEKSNIIKDIRASTDATIRNQGALIKTLEIQIGQMSKVLQERGIE
ncbi:hypothetical protein Tco_0931950, partial [Tanacetum coccineum]